MAYSVLSAESADACDDRGSLFQLFLVLWSGQPDFGAIRHIADAFNFFLDEWATRGIVIFIQWWMWFGATLIILMAGMTSISTSLYESAMVDGASSRQMFGHITLPLLKPVLIYTLVTSLVGGMQMWDIPYMISGGRGAPNGSVMTMNVLMYMKLNSTKGLIGSAASVGVMIFLITSIVALAIFYLLRDKDASSEKRMLRRSRRETQNELCIKN